LLNATFASIDIFKLVFITMRVKWLKFAKYWTSILFVLWS